MQAALPRRLDPEREHLHPRPQHASDKTTATVLVCGRGRATMIEFKIGQYVHYVPTNRFKAEGRNRRAC
jgi:hypothetical protein